VMLTLSALFAGAVAFPFFARLDIDKNVVARLNESASVHTAQALSPSLGQWLTELVPTNVFKTAADGSLLPLIVVSLAFGLSLKQVEEQRRATVLRFFHGIADAFLVFVTYVVKLAPIGVFALAVPLAARMGTSAVRVLALYIVILSAVIVAFSILILYPGAVVFGRVPMLRFAKAAAPAQAVTFASRSSLAALPAVYEGTRDVLALPEDIYGFFLPLAASTFRVGGVMVEVVGALFLARLYGIPLNPLQLMTIMVAAIVTSLTVPGVPGGGIIVMAPVLAAVNIPAEGIGILLAVDTIPDMFRSTANVTAWLCVVSMLSRGATRLQVAARNNLRQ
jgi:proton glutamate symport protein